jgi:hypothetical protein
MVIGDPLRPRSTGGQPMTCLDAPEELKCPACGSDKVVYGWSYPPMEGVVQCYAEGCEVMTVSDTEDEAIARWLNGEWDYKVTGYDEKEYPIYTPRALIAQDEQV